MKWHIISPQSLHMRAWEDEAVVYDARSGNTHLLGLGAATVLAEVRQAPADATFLAQVLSAMEPGQRIDAVQARLETMLAELAGISLIRPTAP